MLTLSMFKASFPERHPVQNVACEQALQGTLVTGREKNLLLRLWNLNIEKVDVECCRLAEMTLVMMSLPLVCVFTCFQMFFFYIRTHFSFTPNDRNLTVQSRGSHRGIQIPETWLQALLHFLPR